MVVGISAEQRVLIVNDYVTPLGEWDVILFSRKLPEEICSCILAMALPNDSQGSDQVAWNPSADGRFSVKSVYEGLCMEEREQENFDWK